MLYSLHNCKEISILIYIALVLPTQLKIKLNNKDVFIEKGATL
jgi:hypothetical protein